MESRNLSGRRRQSSRLQMRAPASIKINPVTEWNVAIPLLSPLVQSPNNLTAEIKSCSNVDKEAAAAAVAVAVSAAEKPAVVMTKWQHPAAPFCYEPAPFLSFVCTGNLDR